MMDYRAGQVIEVTTRDVAHGGWCVARPEDGPVVFVRHTLPGETVLARLTEVTSRLARADAVEILKASPDRVQAPCPHAHPGGCGGCDWQHAALPAQRALKAAVVRQQLRRLAGLDREVTVEALPGDEEPGGEEPRAEEPGGEEPGGEEPGGEEPGGEEPGGQGAGARPAGGGLGWRTRVQFSVRRDGVAGLRAHRSHDVIDVGQCLIAHPALTDLGVTGRRWPGTSSVEALVAVGSGERAVVITPGRAGPGGGAGPGGSAGPGGRTRQSPGTPRVRGGSTPQFPPASPAPPAPPDSLYPPGADSVLRRAGHSLTPLRGRSYLSQHAAGRDWRVAAGAFWQVHPGAADVLTDVIMAELAPEPGDVALDLYCGAGLFAGSLAQAVGPGGTVIGVEADNAAVRDARHNLREWPWARVHKGDVADVLDRGGQLGAIPPARLVVADPPRAGLAREVIDYLGAPENGAARFAYVSCDPATMARDIGLLLGRGWTLGGLRAFDAFPMTHHVECVATLLAPPAARPA
jgi:tRNA/tmRNA/rRNA uracil-C5-methylase (TrmA/RlmC/RlmD family)